MVDSSAEVPREEHAPLNATGKVGNGHGEDYDTEIDHDYGQNSIWSSRNVILSKCLLAGVVLYAALLAYTDGATVSSPHSNTPPNENPIEEFPRRRLTGVMGETMPSYMNDLNNDLMERKKLFEETPPEEIKYWFEYTGPLQVSSGNYFGVP